MVKYLIHYVCSFNVKQALLQCLANISNRPFARKVKYFPKKIDYIVTSYSIAVVAEINALKTRKNSSVEDLKLAPSQKYTVCFYIA